MSTGGRLRRSEAGERTGGEDMAGQEQRFCADSLSVGGLAQYPGPGGPGE